MNYPNIKLLKMNKKEQDSSEKKDFLQNWNGFSRDALITALEKALKNHSRLQKALKRRKLLYQNYDVKKVI